jgi:carbon storage regulator
MLVLTRKVGEKIHIGEDIVVTLLEIKGNRIRLGVEAPISVTVLRSELMEKDLASLQVAEAGAP